MCVCECECVCVQEKERERDQIERSKVRPKKLTKKIGNQTKDSEKGGQTDMEEIKQEAARKEIR